VRVPIVPLSLHHRLLEPPEVVEAQLAATWASFLAQYQAAMAKSQPQASSAAASSDGPGDAHDGPGGSLAPIGGARNSGAEANAATPPAMFPVCTLTLTGNFSLSQMHEWVGGCLPDVPQRLTGKRKLSSVFILSLKSETLALLRLFSCS
jgi:hypothetical protein